MFHEPAVPRVLVMAIALTALAGNVEAGALAAAPRTLIRNAALVLTMDPATGAGELGVREHVDILLEGDTIEQIGQHLKVSGAQVVDATGRIVLPGFVDTHDHLYQSLIRGCGTDQDLNGWLRACVFPLSRFEFRPGDVYRGVRLSTLDLIGTGITTVVDWSQAPTPGFAEENVRALADSGLRFAFAYSGSADPAVIAHMRHVKRTLIDPSPRATFQVGSRPGTGSTVLPRLLAMSGLARELGVKLHVHLLENISQTQEQVFESLAQAGALGPSLLGAHGIHLTDADVALLAKHDVHHAQPAQQHAAGLGDHPAARAQTGRRAGRARARRRDQ